MVNEDEKKGGEKLTTGVLRQAVSRASPRRRWEPGS